MRRCKRVLYYPAAAALLSGLLLAGAAGRLAADPRDVEHVTLPEPGPAHLPKLQVALDYMDAQRFHKASVEFHALIQQGLPPAESVFARVRLGECLVAIGARTSASLIYMEALQLARGTPSYGDILSVWGRLVSSTPGHPLMATQALVALPQRDDPPHDETLRYLRGLLALQAGDDGKAVVAFEDIDLNRGLAARADLQRGAIFARLGVVDDARAALEQALTRLAVEERDERTAGLEALAHLDLGRLAYGAGDLAPARRHYELAAANARHGEAARRELAWLTLREDRVAEAHQQGLDLMARPTWPPDGALLLALAYLRTGQVDQAELLLDRYRDTLRDTSAILRAWQDKHPRQSAEVAALGLIVQSSAPSEPAEGDLPEGLRRLLVRDWRVEAAREQVESAAREIQFLTSRNQQPPFFLETPLGKHLPQAVDANTQQALKYTGQVIWDQVEAQAQLLDRMGLEGLRVRKEAQQKGADTGLPPWTGAPLPAWTPTP